MPTATARPSVLFVCVKNGGKSQLAAALMKQTAGNTVHVDSAGTHPGTALNKLAVESLAELDIDITSQTPKAITDDLVRAADLVVTLGAEANVEPVPGTQFMTWETDEPSVRGIEGIERMRLVRDDIAARTRQLAAELGAALPDQARP